MAGEPTSSPPPSPPPVARPRRSRGRRLAFGLIALGFALVLSLLALEVGLRLFWSGFYLKSTGEHLRQSFTRSFENRPDFEGELHEPEFTMHIRHNALGCRGPEVAPTKAPGTFRVVAVGDSFTYGIGVNDDETFCARMRALDPRVEVVNTGVNNYGTNQELLALQEVGLPLKPDVVLVCLFWNDIANNYERPEIGYFLRDGALVYEPDPSLAKPRSTKRGSPLRHSYAYRLLSDRLRTAKNRLRTMAGLEDDTQNFTRPETVEQAWALQLALLDEIARRCAAAGSKVMVVIIPDQKEVYPDLEVTGLGKGDHLISPRVVAWGKERGVPVLELAPALRAAVAGGAPHLYYPIDRHLIAAGHALIAPVILKALYDAGWVPPPR